MALLNDLIYDEFDAEQLNIILKAALVTLRNENVTSKLAINCDCNEEDLEDIADQIAEILKDC